MSFCTPTDLVNLKKNAASAITSPPVYAYTLGQVAPALINRRNARLILDTCLRAAMERHQGNKANRPWHIVDVTEKLDPEQPWFGFEFETGFCNNEDYQKVIKYFWSRFPYSAIDIEGYGPYSAELTFSPCNGSDLDDGSFGLMKLVKYINRNKIPMASWSPSEHVGTHVNISTPKFRSLSLDDARTVCDAVGRMLQSMSVEQKIELFGRDPYGYVYLRGNSAKKWIEFKLFNSTSDEDQVRKYADVAKRLAALMDAVIDSSPDQSARYAGIAAVQEFWGARPASRSSYLVNACMTSNNVYEFLKGQTDAVEAVLYVGIPDNIYYYGSEDERNAAIEQATNVALDAIASYQAANNTH